MTLNGLFNHKTKSVIAAAGILALAGLLSRLLGFGRNALLAYFYGAGDILDAYFLAFRLPDFVFNLLFFGAFSVGFVPVFIKLKNENKESAWRLVNDLLNLTLGVFILFSAVFFVLAPWILRFIAPGFGPEKMALAVKLSRIIFLQPIFLGVSMIFSGILQSSHKFLSYALAPIFYNLGIIIGILFFAPRLGPLGLAWGVVLGAFLHMLSQYPAAKASGFFYKPVFSFRQKGLRRIFKIIIPRSASLILAQTNLLIMAAIASFLGSGRVAIFNFANDLSSSIFGVVAVPLGVAVFPLFAEYVSKGKIEELSKTALNTLRQLLFVIIPATVLFFVLRAQIVRLTLGYGKFGWVDTVLTIQTLGWLLAGLVFQGILAIVMRLFFAFEDIKTTFWVLLCGILVGLGVSLALAPTLNVSALAVGVSAGTIFDTLVLYAIISKRVKGLGVSNLIKPVGVFILGAVTAGLTSHYALYFLDRFLDTHKVLHLIIQGGLAGLAGALVYLLVTFLFNIQETKELVAKCGFGRLSLPDVLEDEIRRP